MVLKTKIAAASLMKRPPSWMLGLLVLGFGLNLSAGEVEELARQLGSVDLTERREAAYELAEKGSAALPALDALVDALEDKDAQVWFEAITAIGKIGPPAASSASEVAKHLGSPSQQKSYRAAWCLSCFGGEAIPVLAQALKHATPQHRAGAVLALSRFQDFREDVRKLLSEAIQDEQLMVAEQAVQSMVSLRLEAEIISALSAPRTEIVVAAAMGLSKFEQLPETVSSDLLRLCQSSNLQIKAAAISAVGASQVQADELEELVKASVEQADPVLTNALIVLVKKRERDPELVNAINMGLKSKDSKVRANAAVVLAAAGVDSELTAKALMDALDISESDTAEIQYAIFRMGKPVVDHLLHHRTSTSMGKARIIDTLSRFGESIVGPLLIALRSDDAEMSTTAADVLCAMETLPNDAVAALVNALESSTGVQQLAILTALNMRRDLPEGALEIARRLIVSEQDTLRAAVIPLLASNDPEGSEKRGIFKAVSADTSPVVRKALLDAIKNSNLSLEAYEMLLHNSLADHDDLIKLKAANVLATQERCPQIYEEKLIQLMDEESREVQLAALRALATIETKTPSSAKKLATKLSSSENEILIQALRSLGQFQKIASEEYSVVSPLLKNSASDIRSAAMICISQIAPDAETAIDSLLPLLRDQDWMVRKATAIQLGTFGSRARKAVSDLFLMLQSDEDEDAARSALKAIDDAGPDSLEVLLKGLDSDDRGIRFYAMFLIGKIGPEASAALPKLRAMLEDSDSSRFRETIQQAINRIDK
ncbi:MAG: HEAT repeat domain-containing protein [Planctomycetota bacterium]|nr:HEAT repeat domain-containing protein [Planctomycetota bacterium]